MVDIESMLGTAVQSKASDIHIKVGKPPIMRINTQLVEMSTPVITEEDAKQMVLGMIGPERFGQFETNRDIDFATTLSDQSRFRVNAHFQNETIAIAFRVISSFVPDIDTLYLPPMIKELTQMPRGLVLVTGPTGSGKSTTLAAMIGAINKSVDRHIITFEDPVEYALHDDKRSVQIVLRSLRVSSMPCDRTQILSLLVKCVISKQQAPRLRRRRPAISS